MRFVIRALLILLLIAVVAGTIFILTWDIPAPSQPVERVIDDDRFPD